MDFDFMDDLFDDAYWLERTASASNFWQQQGTLLSASVVSSYNLPTDIDTNNTSHMEPNSHNQMNCQEETERFDASFLAWPSLVDHECNGSERHRLDDSVLVEGNIMNRKLSIAPSGDPNPAASVQKRLIQAFEYLKNTRRDDVLIQIWVPVMREGRYVLSTNNQPFSLDPKSKSLEYYRNVSGNYHFAVEKDSKEFFGLPGRVFLKKWPEWTPDVRLLSREDYPRVDYAQQYNISGTLALPVFERGSATCLAVVEIITTGAIVDCRPELDGVCKALEAVDLRSSSIFSPPEVKDHDESYQAALIDLKEIVTFICNTHNLPLAQSWASCTQLGKHGCHYNDETSACFSIVSGACYVQNERVSGFHEACCKHHLLKGEGVVGGALMTNEPCFTTDISAFSETEYPLAYLAKRLELHGAVAIRLRSIYNESMDFIIEFLLPPGCKDSDEQKQIVSSFLPQILEYCSSLRFVSDQELAAETLFPLTEKGTPPSRVKLVKENKTKWISSSSSEEATLDELSWIARMMEAQQKGKCTSVSMGLQKEEPEEELAVNTHWINTKIDLNPGPGSSLHKKIVQDGSKGSSKLSGELYSINGQQRSSVTGNNRRIKAERIISLEVLRQYFSGSLKDAAASIGVCPTTLKRICRQHGITRWPSRKIRKVGHSLKKLQLVIDSVQGSNGAIQLSSFYTNFPGLMNPSIPGNTSLSTLKMDDHLKQPQSQPEGSLLTPATTASKSTSSCSHSSSSSFCTITEAKDLNTANPNVFGAGGASPAGVALLRAVSDAKLHDLVHEETKFLVKSPSHKLFEELSPLGHLLKNANNQFQNGRSFRMKATFGEEKIRFSMPRCWGFKDLQAEISRRFSIEIDDTNKVDMRYLDEDSEWILLTCDDDLKECIDIHISLEARTIKLSLSKAPYPNLGSSIDSCGPY